MKKPPFQDCVNCKKYIDCLDADTVHSSGCDEFEPEQSDDYLTEFREMPDRWHEMQENGNLI
jgi:hypothetical protein